MPSCCHIIFQLRLTSVDFRGDPSMRGVFSSGKFFVFFCLDRLHGGDNVQIKRYFVSFWNGVDLRYKLLKGPKIRISIAGIIISRVSKQCVFLCGNFWILILKIKLYWSNYLGYLLSIIDRRFNFKFRDWNLFLFQTMKVISCIFVLISIIFNTLDKKKSHVELLFHKLKLQRS